MRRILIATSALAGLIAACTPQKELTGAQLFGEFCASCHGATGKGDGAMAAGLAKRPANLTTISARNGGKFPMARVLSTIDGYTRARAGHPVMPEFGVILQDGPVVMYDTGDGIPTPTPERLIALGEYLRSIQK